MLRHLIKWTAIGGLTLMLTACGKKEPAEAAVTTPPPAETPVAEPTAAADHGYKTSDQIASYGIGYNIGSSITREDSVVVDQEAMIAGLKDGLALTPSRVDNASLQAASNELKQRAEEKVALSNETNLEAANAFLKKNAQRPGVTVTASGLQYEVISSSSDPAATKPTTADTVTVHYHGTLPDGTVFDSSIQRGQPISFPLGEVIPGWIEGLQLMSVGDKWKLFLPPAIGYGDSPAGLIPANSALIFEVELLGVTPPDGGQ